MRKIMLAGTSVFALAIAAATPAFAAESSYGSTSTTVTSSECGVATVTWANNTPDKFSGDYRVGDEQGKSDDATELDDIAEGPLAGQPFGEVYHQRPVPAGETVSKTITVEPGEGTVSIDAWVKRGPEQKAFSQDSYDLARCAPADNGNTGETTTPPTTPPAGGGDQASGDAQNGDAQTDDTQSGDEATAEGLAPVPTPAPAHIAVTG